MTQISAEIIANEAVLLKTSLSTTSSSATTNSSFSSSSSSSSSSEVVVVDLKKKMKLNSTENDEPNDDAQYFVELSSREMAIDCPEGFIPESKTKPAYPLVGESFPTTALNRNLLIKPLLNILLKSSAKMTGVRQQQQQQQQQQQLKMHTTIELEAAECIQSSTRNQDLSLESNAGQVNNCFVMDSSKETTMSSNNQQQQPLLLLSSPSTASSSTSLIKSEFINNLNTEATNMSSPDFNKNIIVIKSVEIGNENVDVVSGEFVTELDLSQMMKSLNDGCWKNVEEKNLKPMDSLQEKIAVPNKKIITTEKKF